MRPRLIIGYVINQSMYTVLHAIYRTRIIHFPSRGGHDSRLLCR